MSNFHTNVLNDNLSVTRGLMGDFLRAPARKARQETGLERVQPIQVLEVCNTFFPTSHCDTDVKRGIQTVNPIVLVELLDVDVRLDDMSENYR
jgi:hypothetical protein